MAEPKDGRTRRKSAQFIAELMQKRFDTYRSFAEEIGVSCATVWAWRHGELPRGVHIDRIDVYAREIGMHYDRATSA